jgi:hypothetical protein
MGHKEKPLFICSDYHIAIGLAVYSRFGEPHHTLFYVSSLKPSMHSPNSSSPSWQLEELYYHESNLLREYIIASGIRDFDGSFEGTTLNAPSKLALMRRIALETRPRVRAQILPVDRRDDDDHHDDHDYDVDEVDNDDDYDDDDLMMLLLLLTLFWCFSACARWGSRRVTRRCSGCSPPRPPPP